MATYYSQQDGRSQRCCRARPHPPGTVATATCDAPAHAGKERNISSQCRRNASRGELPSRVLLAPRFCHPLCLRDGASRTSAPVFSTLRHGSRRPFPSLFFCSQFAPVLIDHQRCLRPTWTSSWSSSRTRRTVVPHRPRRASSTCGGTTARARLHVLHPHSLRPRRRHGGR